MNKKFRNFFTALMAFVVCASFSYAQSLEFTHLETEKTVNPDSSSAVFHATVKNISSSDVSVKITVTEVSGEDDYDVSWCDPNSCYFLMNNPQTSPAFTLTPDGTTEEQFHLEISPYGIEGTSVVKVRFFNVNDENDYIEFEAIATFDKTTSVTKFTILENNFSSFAPNPANNATSFDFDLTGIADKSTLEIHSATGALVKTINITNHSGNVTINTSDLPQGIYYCTLFVNSETRKTRILSVTR